MSEPLPGERVDHCNRRTGYEMISHPYAPSDCAECAVIAVIAATPDTVDLGPISLYVGPEGEVRLCCELCRWPGELDDLAGAELGLPYLIRLGRQHLREHDRAVIDGDVAPEISPQPGRDAA